MPFDVTANFQETIQVPASPAEVSELLGDVPRSVSHFPQVEALDQLPQGDKVFRWTMKKVGLGRVSIQVVYACTYGEDTQGRLAWTPVAGVGNARCRGNWTVIESSAGGSRVTLTSEVVVTFPFPSLLRRLGEPLIAGENNRLVRQYLDNLAVTFQGGDGRVRK